MDITATLLLAFISAAQTFDLPKGLNSAMCYVESNHAVQAIHVNDGGSDSIGICQIKLATARMLGFKGTKQELANPVINIHYSSKFIRFQLDRYHGDLVKAVAAYNAGTHRVNSRGFTVNRRYVQKVMLAWSEGK